MKNYEEKALLFAEKYGVIEYEVQGNTMVYYQTYTLENRTIKATVNLDTMEETREQI